MGMAITDQCTVHIMRGSITGRVGITVTIIATANSVGIGDTLEHARISSNLWVCLKDRKLVKEWVRYFRRGGRGCGPSIIARTDCGLNGSPRSFT
jgi:hypothetical protein